MESCRPTALAIAALALALAGCERPETTGPTPPDPDLDVVFGVPQEAPGPPFYSPIANGSFLPNDGAWAAIPFLRDPGCVPAGVDLLAIVGPMAFRCALTVEGQEHWENGPPSDPAPRQTVYRGLGTVPIVFVEWAELEPALDGGLFLPELLGLPSAIVGTATVYKETDILGVSGPLGPGRGMYKITARGMLADARSFRLLVNEVQGELRGVQIRFGG
jgi:hypothetical protein